MSLFLTLPATTWVAQNAHAFAIRDGFPVTPRHTLVITRRLVSDWFSATLEKATVPDGRCADGLAVVHGRGGSRQAIPARPRVARPDSWRAFKTRSA